MHRLNASRVIDVRNCRNFRTRNIELVDAEKCLLVGSHGATPIFAHFGDEQHVGAIGFEFKPIRNILAQYRRRERPKALTILDLQIEVALHGW